MIKSFKHKGLKKFSLMTMHNPPHPGEFIYATYMEPFGYSCRFVAKQLDVATSTFSRILKGQSAISPEMALRLSVALGRSSESWLIMQNNHDLWRAKQKINLTNVHPINFEAA